MDAFDGPGMLLTGVLVRCMEKEGIALGRETSADQILENLSKRYPVSYTHLIVGMKISIQEVNILEIMDCLVYSNI